MTAVRTEVHVEDDARMALERRQQPRVRETGLGLPGRRAAAHRSRRRLLLLLSRLLLLLLSARRLSPSSCFNKRNDVVSDRIRAIAPLGEVGVKSTRQRPAHRTRSLIGRQWAGGQSGAALTGRR